jgi:hypothetical protein
MEASQELALLSEEDYATALTAILDGTPIPNIGTGDPAAVSRAIAERIAKSETFEEAFAPQDLDAWTNYIGVPVFVQDFHLNPTGFLVEGQPSVYAVADIANVADGDVKTVTCGGRNVLMQLVKMKQKGWMDNPVVLVSKRTAEGYDALWLQSAVAAD